MNYTLAEKMRSMMHSVNIPYSLGAETWETAQYLYTIGPVQAPTAF